MKSSSILLTSDKQKIACAHYKAGHRKLVIICHGFFNSKDSRLLLWLKDQLIKEYDVLMFDFRGHGKSSGLFCWTSREGRDLRAVLDSVRGAYAAAAMISFSLGAAVSINVLADTSDEIASLICVSSPCEVKKIDYKFWQLNPRDDLFYTLFTAEGRAGRGARVGPFWLRKKSPLQSAARLSMPVLYIHGEKDWVVKPWHSRALYAQTRSPKKLAMLKNGSHAEFLLRSNKEETTRLIKDWLRATLKEGE
ncbi:MAG TPA: alpha/beta fold hydrolase [Candidatus Omnitrophota bacterium]|nr:alpha/beta fold hydrolase [Candidatus Omnitrophota bacterium]HRZ14374.1 alpha/beta fold hydrolase [Candidatus Omnitrophota bacterium]